MLGTDSPSCSSGYGNTKFRKRLHHITTRKETYHVNPLTPELNPSEQRCLTRFLLGILLLEPCILLIYAWKTNKCNNYSFSFLIMYGSSYMFRHYIVTARRLCKSFGVKCLKPLEGAVVYLQNLPNRQNKFNWQWQLPPKQWYQHTKRHGYTSQKSAVLTHRKLPKLEGPSIWNFLHFPLKNELS
jgi:hypothetical protein